MNTKTTPRTQGAVRVPSSARASLILPALTAILLPATAGAQSADAKEKTSFEKLWDHATLYKDDSNSFIQEFKLRGRYQGQYHRVESDQGSGDGWEDRRSRFGFDAKLFEKQIEVRADFQSNDGFHDFYDGLVDAYIRWKPTKTLSFTAGKLKPFIGEYDWLSSTNSQPTFERSQIFNQLSVNRATGFTADGKVDQFLWRAGIYSNDTPNSTGGSGSFGDGEFGDFNGGVSYSFGVGYDLAKVFGVDESYVKLDWLHSDRKAGDLVLGRYDDIVSGTFLVAQDELAVVFEAFYATGGEGAFGDVFGFFIQPTYNITDNIQLVGRYTASLGEGGSSLLGQTRYERDAPGLPGAGNTATGSRYQALYLGGQYFINGDKLKLMAGAEYAVLDGGSSADDIEAVTFLTGVRFSF